MGTPTDIAMRGYAAFGRRDIPALLELLSDDVEWRFLGKPETGTPFGGTCKGKQQVAEWFATLAQSDEIVEFQPLEFLEGTNHVTVIGRTRGRRLPAGKLHDTDWVQIFCWRSDSRITRWIGTGDTAARLSAT
ncbi:nuclear transport factor 2 family protein [Variovorax sp. OV329]|uniref:nuclear transport factor 2 family protein n=1 Tax=Variovorax sp. OV329 TaxID=1882825 RepID=UPI0008F0307F|nr:nuclear transport factor 2 family protein [Variovorax sp. OV329]SFM18502.1 hypothetical protein SAMN05444747_103213 [Variovorax sp. OV329]